MTQHHKIIIHALVQVYERRPDPLEAARQPANSTDADDASASDDDDSEYDDVPIGGGVRLEANGLKALTAISRKIAAGVLSEGVYAQHVLLHDTESEWLSNSAWPLAQESLLCTSLYIVAWTV